MVERSANVSEPQRPVPRIGPRVISSIEEAMVARRGPRVLTGGDSRPVDQLLHAMRTVKAARFCAASRFERKHTLSQFAMAMVSLYFVGLSVWQAVYAATIDEPTNRLLTLVSIMSSIFLLVLALIEAMNDYRIKAHHMHTCALAVNDLFHELKIVRPSEAAEVQDFRRRYNEVVRSCPINHSRVDYAMARAERGVPWTEKASAWLYYACDVYALYGLSMAVPPMVLLLFR